MGKLLFVSDLAYNTGLTMLKMAALLFYTRLFSIKRSFRILLWAVGSLVAGWWIAIDFLTLFFCTPPRKTWTPEISGHCLNPLHTALGTTLSNVVIDVIILLLPFPTLWALQVGTRKKMGLILVFASGYW